LRRRISIVESGGGGGIVSDDAAKSCYITDKLRFDRDLLNNEERAQGQDKHDVAGHQDNQH
jgi:hypothetical protein